MSIKNKAEEDLEIIDITLLLRQRRCRDSIDEELQKIAQRKGRFTSYEVEVCSACGWNHLRRRYPLD